MTETNDWAGALSDIYGPGTQVVIGDVASRPADRGVVEMLDEAIRKWEVEAAEPLTGRQRRSLAHHLAVSIADAMDAGRL